MAGKRRLSVAFPDRNATSTKTRRASARDLVGCTSTSRGKHIGIVRHQAYLLHEFAPARSSPFVEGRELFADLGFSLQQECFLDDEIKQESDVVERESAFVEVELVKSP